MRALAVVVSLSFLGACSLFLDESPPAPGKDAAAGGADAGAEDAAACDITVAAATLLDDTVIGDGSAENTNFDGFQNMTIGDELASVGLLRFMTPPLPEDARVVQVTLTLPHAMESDQCDDPCGPCDGIARSGELEIFVGRNDWTADTATWLTRGDGPWEVDGAKGTVEDRTASIGVASYTADMDLVFVDDVSDIETMFAGDAELTLILDGTQEGADDSIWTKLVVSTRENDCNGKRAAELTLGYCLRETN